MPVVIPPFMNVASIGYGTFLMLWKSQMKLIGWFQNMMMALENEFRSV